MPVFSRNYSRHPYVQDVSQELQSVLARNGMQAHLRTDNNGNFQLIVIGHDSPALTYNLTNKQAKDLMESGSLYLNKKGYNTLVSIVRKDFDVPLNYVIAKNAGGAVNIGQYGHRVSAQEMGLGRPYTPYRRGMRGWGGDFLGWRPYHRGSFHVLERPDGTLRPGEAAATRMLSNGRGKASSMGFYYKGGSQQPTNEASQEELNDLTHKMKIVPPKAQERKLGEAKPYSEVITSDVYFNRDKWKEVLEAHGISFWEDTKTGVKYAQQQFGNTRVDTRYQISDQTYNRLMANNLDGKDGVSMNERLNILNKIFSENFDTESHPITKDMLESKQLISIPYHPDSYQELEKPFIQSERAEMHRQQEARRIEALRMEDERIRRDPQAINGKDAALIGRTFTTSTAHGRGLVVGEIRVERTAGEHYVMSAVINGHKVTHPISQKVYDQFLAVDDKHRLMLFDKVFKEVEMKKEHGNGIADDMYMASSRGHENGMSIEHSTSRQVDGAALRDLNAKKSFYREGAHGREVEVGNINVERSPDTGKFKMTAVLDGVAVTHEITQKEFDRFLAVDDYQRMKMFSNIFKEVDMKTRPEYRTNVGAAILAALVAVPEAVAVGTGIAHDIQYGMRPPMPKPDIYASAIKAEGYMKPGVAIGAPAIAAANFDMARAGMDDLAIHENLGRGR